MYKYILQFAVVITVIFSFNATTYARPLHVIKQSNELRICVAGSAYHYYQQMGMTFADWLKVKPVLIHLPSWDHQFHNSDGKTIKSANYTPHLLKTGQCDIYPNDLIINEWRKKKLDFQVLYQTRMVVLIHRRNQPYFHRIMDLQGKNMAVMKNTTYHSWVETANHDQLKSDPVKIRFMKTYDAWRAVDEGKVDFTVSNADGVLKHSDKYTKHLIIAFPVGSDTNVGWAYEKNSIELAKAIETFFQQQQRRDSEFDLIWLSHGIRLSDYMLVMADML